MHKMFLIKILPSHVFYKYETYIFMTILSYEEPIFIMSFIPYPLNISTMVIKQEAHGP